MKRLLFGLCFALLVVTLPYIALAHKVPLRNYNRAHILELINNERITFNENNSGSSLKLLGLDDDLTAMAQAHAIDTAVSYDTTTGSYLGHISSNDNTLQDRIRAHSIKSIRSAGEVVAMRYYGMFVSGNVNDAISNIMDAISEEKSPNNSNKQNFLVAHTHVGIGMEMYRSVEANPDMEDQSNAFFLVIVFAEFVDDRNVLIPDPATVTEDVPPTAVQSVPDDSPYARFRRRTRISTKLEIIRGKGSKRIIYRKPKASGTGYGIIVDPESEEAQQYFKNRLQSIVQRRKLQRIDEDVIARKKTLRERVEERRQRRLRKTIGE